VKRSRNFLSLEKELIKRFLMSEAMQSILRSWTLPVGVTVSLAVIIAVYFRGWLQIRQTRPELFPVRRPIYFFTGLLALWLALASPLDTLVERLLVAHMTQHLILMSVAPPLILLGAPVVPLLRGLPRLAIQKFLRPGLSSGTLNRIGRTITHPIFAWLAMNLAYVAWHIPAAYEFALNSEGWHECEHACFFFTSLLFWFSVIQPWPAVSRCAPWLMLLYLLAADIVNTALSFFLTFSGRLLYPSYGAVPRIASLTPLADQAAAGAMMWVLGSVAFLLPAALITIQLLSPQKAAFQQDRDRTASSTTSSIRRAQFPVNCNTQARDEWFSRSPDRAR
jgi:cytochrome c oxidase assembly factor CtaG